MVVAPLPPCTCAEKASAGSSKLSVGGGASMKASERTPGPRVVEGPVRVEERVFAAPPAVVSTSATVVPGAGGGEGVGKGETDGVGVLDNGCTMPWITTAVLEVGFAAVVDVPKIVSQAKVDETVPEYTPLNPKVP